MADEGRPHEPGVTTRTYGETRDGDRVRAFTLDGGDGGVRVDVLEYGGIVARLEAPDRAGRRVNVVLGRPTLADYEEQNPYFGAIIGRYANRIRGGAFAIGDVPHRVTRNQGEHHLHGGARGFDKRVWRGEALADAMSGGVVLTYTSRDGEEGYPGRLQARAAYRLIAPSVLRIELEATTDAPTVVNLTTHSYFNLAGEGAGTICDHVLTVDADAYTPVDGDLIPFGEVAPVGGTPFDLRRGAHLGPVLRNDHPQIANAKGVDHNFVLRPPSDSGLGGAGPPTHLRRAARLAEPGSGRVLEVHTDQPGLQVYTGNALTGALLGTGGRRYRQGDGIALETQTFPDAPNVAAFPDALLRPGETYRSVTELRFEVEGRG